MDEPPGEDEPPKMNRCPSTDKKQKDPEKSLEISYNIRRKNLNLYKAIKRCVEASLKEKNQKCQARWRIFESFAAILRLSRRVMGR